MKRHFRVSPAVAVALAVTVGLGLRLWLAYAYRGNHDEISYEIVARIMLRGGNVFAETHRYNYSPLWAYCLWGLGKFTLATGLPFHLVVRGFLSVVDVCNGLLIAGLAVKLGVQSGTRAFCLYLLNPVAILIVGYHGQFDTLAMLPLLGAVYFSTREPDRAANTLAWLLGTFAILFKHITLFGVWTLFVYQRSLRWAGVMMGAALGVFLLSFVPYLPEGGEGIMENVFRYQGSQSLYGLGMLLPKSLGQLIFFPVMATLPLLARHRLQLPLAKAMELSFVAFLALTYGIGEQYFLLPVIWGVVFASRWYWAFTAIATVFLAGSENNLHLPGVPSAWNTVWLAASGWLLAYFLVWKKGLHVPPPFSWRDVFRGANTVSHGGGSLSSAPPPMLAAVVVTGAE